MALAIDINSRKVSKSAIERFRMENRVEVYTMRWLKKPRPSGQHMLVIIKIATKEDMEKLLRLDNVSFSGNTILISPFKERCTLVAYFKYKRFRHRARNCMRLNTYNIYSQEGYLQCKIVNLHYINCQGLY